MAGDLQHRTEEQRGQERDGKDVPGEDRDGATRYLQRGLGKQAPAGGAVRCSVAHAE